MPTPEVREGVKRLFDSVGISAVTLTESRAELRGELKGPLTLALGRRASGERSPDRTKLQVRLRFSLEGKESEQEGSQATLSITGTFEATYDVPPELEASQEAIEFFAYANGTFNLWPYWREFVQSTSLRMGIPGLTIPTYRIEEVFSGPGSFPRRKPRRSAKADKLQE